MKHPKKKGSQWERDAVAILNEEFPGTWKKVPMSGAAGTILDIATLKPDLLGNYYHLDRQFAGEAKVGYGGAKQLTVQRAWFDKIAGQASESYSVPILVCKFSGSKSDTRYFISMTFQAWDMLMQQTADLYDENLVLRDDRDVLLELFTAVYEDNRISNRVMTLFEALPEHLKDVIRADTLAKIKNE